MKHAYKSSDQTWNLNRSATDKLTGHKQHADCAEITAKLPRQVSDQVKY